MGMAVRYRWVTLYRRGSPFARWPAERVQERRNRAAGGSARSAARKRNRDDVRRKADGAGVEEEVPAVACMCVRIWTPASGTVRGPAHGIVTPQSCQVEVSTKVEQVPLSGAALS
jgi:hypothetical protein